MLRLNSADALFALLILGAGFVYADCTINFINDTDSEYDNINSCSNLVYCTPRTNIMPRGNVSFYVYGEEGCGASHGFLDLVNNYYVFQDGNKMTSIAYGTLPYSGDIYSTTGSKSCANQDRISTKYPPSVNVHIVRTGCIVPGAA